MLAKTNKPSKNEPKPMSKKEFFEMLDGLTDDEMIKVYDWLLNRPQNF
jgi:hypothetical protein